MTVDPPADVVKFAALMAVARHLQQFPESTADEDLPDNNPYLTEGQAGQGQRLARAIAASIAAATADGFVPVDLNTLEELK